MTNGPLSYCVDRIGN